MAQFIIHRYSHNFAVTGYSEQGKDALFHFCRQLILKQKKYDYLSKKSIWEISSVFAAATKDRKEFRFHINCWDRFVTHIRARGFSLDGCQIIDVPRFIPQKVSLVLKDLREPREDQPQAIEYLCNTKIRSRLLTLQPGKGKTFTSMKAVYAIGERTVIVIKGGYVEKWIADVEKSFVIKKGDLMVVRGHLHLQRLLELALTDELEAKIIIITGKTLYNYLEDYEKFSGEGLFPVKPIDFFPLLKAGVRLIDEVHQDFHFNFRLDLYTHIDNHMNLSGTMDPDNPALKEMYLIMFPQHDRYVGLPYDKYVAVKAIKYSLEDPQKIKYKNPVLGYYSQNKLEESILENPLYTRRFLEIVDLVVRTDYVPKRKPGEKMLIFAGKVEMCTVIRDFLTHRYPDLKVSRYAGSAGDEYEDLLASDITCTTLKSAGTAVDIPGLMVSFMTDSMNSGQSNDQVLWRTRKPDDLSIPLFIYLVCLSIPKQVEYHERKKELFKDKVISHNEYDTGLKV
jgi:hypothetical protein